METDQEMPSVLVATIGAEPQVIAIAAQLLLQRRESLKAVEVLHTNPFLEPINSAMSALKDMFGKRPDWPDLKETQIQTDDLLLREDLEEFETILFQSLKNWKFQDYRVRLLLAGGRKTSSMVGMVTAQMVFDRWDKVLYLSSDEKLRESRRYILEPEDKAQLHEIYFPVSVMANGSSTIMGSDTPAEARQRLEQDNQEKMEQFFAKLTSTERMIAKAVATSTLSTKELAAQLNRSSATISNTLTRIYRKMEDVWGVTLHKGIKREKLRDIMRFDHGMPPGSDGEES